MVATRPTEPMTLPSATFPQRLGRKTMFFLVCYAALRAGPLRGRRKKLVQRTQRALGLSPVAAKTILGHARASAARRSQVPRPFSPSRLMAHACKMARRSGGLDARQELLLVRLGEVLGVSEEKVRDGLERSTSVDLRPTVLAPAAPPALPAAPGALAPELPPPAAPLPALPTLPRPRGLGRAWLAGAVAVAVAMVVGYGLVQARLAREYARGKALAEATTSACLKGLKNAEQGMHAQGLARVDAELERLEAHPQAQRLGYLFAQLHYSRGRILHSEMFHRRGEVDHDVAIHQAYEEAIRLITPLREQAPDTFQVILSGVADYRRDVGDAAEAARLRALLRTGPEFEAQSP